MAKCLACGKNIPSWYTPQLCDFCLSANMIDFFEDSRGLVPSTIPKSKEEIVSELEESSSVLGITIDKVKEWISSPVVWLDLRGILYDNSVLLIDGSTYFDMYPVSNVGVGHILNKLKESKPWAKIKWCDLIAN